MSRWRGRDKKEADRYRRDRPRFYGDGGLNALPPERRWNDKIYFSVVVSSTEQMNKCPDDSKRLCENEEMTIRNKIINTRDEIRADVPTYRSDNIKFTYLLELKNQRENWFWIQVMTIK